MSKADAEWGSNVISLDQALRRGFESPSVSVPRKVALYHCPFSLNSQRVRLTLAEKRIEWQGKIVDPLALDHIKPRYMRRNPSARVPTLIADATIHIDTRVIVRFLNRSFPGPVLAPLGPAGLGEMDEWIERAASLPIEALTARRMPGLRGWLLRRVPFRERRAIRRYRRSAPEYEAHYQARLAELDATLSGDGAVRVRQMRAVEEALDGLGRHLAEREWLVGQSYSLADLYWTPVLARLEQLGLSSLWSDGQRQSIAEYLARLRARPSYDEAILAYDGGRLHARYVVPRLIPYLLGVGGLTVLSGLALRFALGS